MPLTYANGSATVTITRGGVALPGLVGIPAEVRAPGPENISPEGAIISTTVLLNPLPDGVTIKTGDQMTFLVLGGHSGVGQLPKRNILSAPLVPTSARFRRLTVVRVYLEGVLQ